MNSITKRWIRQSLFITILLLLVAVAFVVMFVRNSYYSAATTALLSRINTINVTIAASGKMSNMEKEQMLFRFTEEFSEKDKFEIMLLGADGRILATSSGFRPVSNQHYDDFSLSLQATDGIYTAEYLNQGNEKILGVTAVLPEPTQEIFGVRITTSLTRVDSEVSIIFAFAALGVIAVIAFSVISGLYFVRSIVMPIQTIKVTAGKISKGEFSVRIENKYNDEIGELCNTINNMAAELAKNDEIKNEFISSVSHELRTPLTAIRGWAETMNHTSDKSTLEKGTQVILSETQRLYTMVENLLDFSRIQQAPISLTKEKLDLVAEISEIAIMFAPQAEKQGVEIVFEEPNGIVPILADKNRLKQIFVNLLDNALKYSQDSSKIEIKIDQNHKNNNVVVSIKDYGKGIHPDDIEKVKQKFYKGKGAKRGSGIGLALVTELVKAHGGEFSIESEHKKYTKTSVTLNVVRTMKGI